MRFVKGLFLAAVAALMVAPFAAPTRAQDGGLLAQVRQRGQLICGINNGVPGFGFVDAANNTVSGFDTDFCRALAAAIFGDATKVEFKPIAAADRFTAIGSGEIDVLIRNTTNTFTRDTAQGAEFGPTIFYDGQAILVRTADNVAALADLNGATICAIQGTTTQQNIADATAGSVKVEVLTFENIDQVIENFNQERCNAITSDRSQLVSKKATAANGADWTILAGNISKEPLAPVWKAGDAQWGDLVRWVVYATIIAEEYGVTQENIDAQLANADLNPEAKRLFSVEGELYKNLGLEPTWAVNVIKAVGNYGEIFNRNLGVAPFNFERGLNELWRNGGLVYAPPYR
jgi:general L-amino acid transport system substrate-binding protein